MHLEEVKRIERSQEVSDNKKEEEVERLKKKFHIEK
jgi:hypothetical protein